MDLLLICSEKYASKWIIGLSFVKQQQGMQVDLTYEIRNFCDLGMQIDYTSIASYMCAL